MKSRCTLQVLLREFQSIYDFCTKKVMCISVNRAKSCVLPLRGQSSYVWKRKIQVAWHIPATPSFCFCFISSSLWLLYAYWVIQCPEKHRKGVLFYFLCVLTSVHSEKKLIFKIWCGIFKQSPWFKVVIWIFCSCSSRHIFRRLVPLNRGQLQLILLQRRQCLQSYVCCVQSAVETRQVWRGGAGVPPWLEGTQRNHRVLRWQNQKWPQ